MIYTNQQICRAFIYYQQKLLNTIKIVNQNITIKNRGRRRGGDKYNIIEIANTI